MCISLIVSYLRVRKDMVMPEPGETQQSVCEAVGGPTETNMYVSDQADLRLLLQVQYSEKQMFSCWMHKYVVRCLLATPAVSSDSSRTARMTV